MELPTEAITGNYSRMKPKIHGCSDSKWRQAPPSECPDATICGGMAGRYRSY
jgi:hypothetical protein